MGYVRVSRVGDRDTDSSSYRTEQEQELSIRAVARELGAELLEVIAERNVSGGAMSPGREAAVKLVEDGRADVLIVAHSDRIARNVELDQAIRRRLRSAGGQLVSVSERFDDSTPAGAMFAVVMAAFSAMYRETRRETFTRAGAAAVADGVHVARPPLGYRRSAGKRSPLAPDPNTAPIVAEVFRARAAGRSISELLRILFDAGIRSQAGTPYRDIDVRRLLKRRTYLGIATCSGGAVNEHAHEPLVSEELWSAAQIRRGPVRPQNGRLVRSSRLHGKVYCGTCGSRLDLSDGGSARLPRYCCKAFGCERPPSAYVSDVDNYVAAQLDDLLSGPGIFSDVFVISATAQAFAAAVERVEEAKAERAAYVVAVSARHPDYAAGLDSREAAVEAAEAARDDLSPYRAEGKTREQLAVERVFLGPGRIPTAERVRIVWQTL